MCLCRWPWVVFPQNLENGIGWLRGAEGRRQRRKHKESASPPGQHSHQQICLTPVSEPWSPIPAAARMDLEDMVPSEISQLRKDTYCIIPVIWGIRVVKVMETSRKGVARGWWGREVGLVFNGTSFKLGGWRMVMVAQPCDCA